MGREIISIQVSLMVSLIRDLQLICRRDKLVIRVSPGSLPVWRVFTNRLPTSVGHQVRLLLRYLTSRSADIPVLAEIMC
jgi:hypothetical protein